MLVLRIRSIHKQKDTPYQVRAEKNKCCLLKQNQSHNSIDALCCVPSSLDIETDTPNFCHQHHHRITAYRKTVSYIELCGQRNRTHLIQNK